MTVTQVENFLRKNAKSVDIHYSSISSSVYFSFEDDTGDIQEIRLSDHDLPISYDKRQCQKTVFYSDSWTEFKKELVKTVSVKKQPKKEWKEPVITSDVLEALKKDFDFVNKDFDKLARVYNFDAKTKEFVRNIFVEKKFFLRRV